MRAECVYASQQCRHTAACQRPRAAAHGSSTRPGRPMWTTRSVGLGMFLVSCRIGCHRLFPSMKYRSAGFASSATFPSPVLWISMKFQCHGATLHFEEVDAKVISSTYSASVRPSVDYLRKPPSTRGATEYCEQIHPAHAIWKRVR